MTNCTPRRVSIDREVSPVRAPFSYALTCWAPRVTLRRSDSSTELTVRRSTKGGATTTSVCSSGRFLISTPICWTRCTPSTKSRFIFQLPITRGRLTSATSRPRTFSQRTKTGQISELHQLERRPTASRDKAHVVGQPVLADGRDRVPTAHHADGGRGRDG